MVEIEQVTPAFRSGSAGTTPRGTAWSWLRPIKCRSVDGSTVKPIAIMTKQRSPALPNVPTAAEQGMPNLEAYTWNAIFLPKGAPEAVVKKLHDAALAAMHTPLVKERLGSLGAVIVPDDRATPQYLANFVKSEIEKWAAPIKASGATAD